MDAGAHPRRNPDHARRRGRFVELGLTGVLVASGASNAEAVAGTIIYRFLTVVPTGIQKTSTPELKANWYEERFGTMIALGLGLAALVAMMALASARDAA